MHVVACTHKMDDLQKRHNGSNDDLRRQGLDSGEAFGLEGPYPKQGQDEVGSGSRVRMKFGAGCCSRSLA